MTEGWQDLIEPGVCGLLLVGSHARGEAHEYSDLDLERYWLAESWPHRSGRMLIWRDRLTSLTDLTLARVSEELKRPEQWIWTAGNLRNARILHDPTGAMASLVELARQPGPAGREWAAAELPGWAEEVHKLLGSLALGDDALAFSARFALVKGLTVLAAVDLGLAIETENRFFEQVRAEAGGEWAHAQTVAMSGEVPGVQRTRAALRLFVETAALLPGDAVVEHTLRRLDAPLLAQLRPSHRDIYQRMRADLWPDCEPEELEILLGPDQGLEGSKRYRGYLAEDPLTGEVLGLVELGEHQGGRGHLEGLYVVPELRRGGVGEALVHWSIAELRRWGCTTITSDTWVDQEVSRRLHRRCGFEEIGQDEREVRFRLP